MAKRRAPRPLSGAVEATLREVSPTTLLAAVQRAWAPAVGDAVAREATPVAERDGVVTVACRSATWAQELDLLGDRILSQVRAEMPEGTALGGLRFNARQESV